MNSNTKGWIGVDLDGTLAHYDEWRGLDHIGEPIMPMVNRVREWLRQGIEVRIVTARVSHIHNELHAARKQELKAEIVDPISEWCLKHIGETLPVTCVKDFGMIQLWDDRAVSVWHNTGEIYKYTESTQ